MSARTFALWWLLLLLLHVVTASFFGAAALFYYWIEGKTVDYLLQYYEIGIESKSYKTIALLQALVALPHVMMIVKMLGASLISRSLAFTFPSRKTKSRPKKSSPAWQRCLLPQSARMARWHRAVFGRTGLLGVDGQYFYAIMFLRELLELILQTIQAYRMSYYLPQMLPVRFYVSLLVLNCWATPIIYVGVKKNESLKRELCLICDCALDFAASVIIPCAILASYAKQLVPEWRGFDPTLWFDKVWIAHVKREFQILLVASWRDMIMRLVFSMGMLVAMSDIKDLLEGTKTLPARNKVGPLRATGIGPAVFQIERSKLSETSERSIVRRLRPSGRLSSIQLLVRTATAEFLASKYSRYAALAAHGLLFLWGSIILGLHLSVELHPSIPQCIFQVRPWTKSVASCVLIDLNCHALGISGTRSQTDAALKILDPGMVEDVLVRHCDALEMTPVLEKFSALKMLKVYNSTIIAWDSSAALTNASHPHLETLTFARVNMPDGELPPGLLSPDFPPGVAYIHFCVTNLRSLPDDLDSKWPSLLNLFLELGELTEVPAAVMRLRPINFSLYGNPIRELPSEIFEMDGTTVLHLGHTFISSLPAEVTAVSSTISSIYMTETQISYFPDWFDAFVSRWLDEEAWRPLSAGLTPYCEQLEEIWNGSQADFVPQDDPDAIGSTPPSMLMNASLDNLELLHSIVTCDPSLTLPSYYLEADDSEYGLGGG